MSDEPAFPLVARNVHDEQQIAWGLSKREYFVAMAMQGLCAGMSYEKGVLIDGNELASDAAHIADCTLRRLR